MAQPVDLLSYLNDGRVLAGLTAITAGVLVKTFADKKKKIPGPPVWPVVGSTPCKNDIYILTYLYVIVIRGNRLPRS